jgi:hypothetical protein
VRRDEILDYVTYGEQRDEVRARVMAIKGARRVHVAGALTFLFENRETVRYQVQEMVRVEQMVKEADIQHELDTYNELLGAPGELGSTLLIEIDDEGTRDVKLREWMGLPERIYVLLDDGERAYARFDERQVGEDRLSSVQYLRFPVGDRMPVAVGVAHAALTGETPLSDAQASALKDDLTDR